MNTETVGKAAMRLLGDRSPIKVVDAQKAMQEKYVDNLIEAAMNGEKVFGKEEHFYICVQTRRERLLENVIRNQFYVRKTRPIPQYDLSLYYYDPKDEKMTFVWCIPDKETTHQLAHSCQNPAEGQLAYFCDLFLKNSLV